MSVGIIARLDFLKVMMWAGRNISDAKSRELGRAFRNGEFDPDLDQKEESEMSVEEMISCVMRDMGRQGGLRGGKARANSLTPERRREISKNAAIARWKKR